jgi:hypothetical protein
MQGVALCLVHFPVLEARLRRTVGVVPRQPCFVLRDSRERQSKNMNMSIGHLKRREYEARV